MRYPNPIHLESQSRLSCSVSLNPFNNAGAYDIILASPGLFLDGIIYDSATKHSVFGVIEGGFVEISYADGYESFVEAISLISRRLAVVRRVLYRSVRPSSFTSYASPSLTNPKMENALWFTTKRADGPNASSDYLTCLAI